MKPSLCRLLLPTVFMFGAVSLHAHPGHDGHELTWDLGHLAAHPLATIGCVAVLVAAAWAGSSLAKSMMARRREELIRVRQK